MIPLRDTQPSYTFPFVTIAIIVLNVVAFLYEFSLDPYELNDFIARYGVIPTRFQWMDVLTSIFLHGGWMHLIGNMWFLWIYGDNIEDILGHSQFLIFYLACGVAATVVHIVFNMDSRIPTLGASGAIAGVMGAYVVKFPHSRITTLVPVFVFLTTMEIPAYFILLYWFVIQFFSGIGSVGHSHLSQGGVAWFAHIGGFLAGVLLILLMPTKTRWSHRPEYRW
ncbi:MAG TPA: rhomboid family intramembrane serine protease [Bryobacteraceae bacterium]|nr:rhomboid family intramembrane serine protease [Bryobacteraceae bacterium]